MAVVLQLIASLLILSKFVEDNWILDQYKEVLVGIQ